jgi:4-amino-4-deoxy-L-arabinose transferase-like glycosyltransferase
VIRRWEIETGTSARLREDTSPRPRPWYEAIPIRAWREVLIVLALTFVYGFFQQRPVWNEYSRYDLVRALVDDGTTIIDPYHGNTGDKAQYNGHFYSDKPPGTALLGVPIYVGQVATWQLFGAGVPDPETAVHALTLIECGVATAVLVILLWRFLRVHVGERWGLVVALGYGLASIAFPFATMFFGHAASTFFLFAAFYLLWRWRHDRAGWRPVVAGVSAGLAVLTEFPVVLGVAVLLAYAVWLGRSVAWRFVAGGVPAAAVLAVYDWISFGSPLAIGYQYATTFGEQNRQGIVSIVWPSASNAIELLFGPRGLLRLAPWFGFAPLGLLAAERRRIRPEIAVAVAIPALFLTYNSGALNPFGGWTPGPRYLLPALPFVAVLVALAPRILRVVVAALIAFSAGVFSVATVTMPNAPELFRDPLYELWLPRFASHDIAMTFAWLRWGLHGVEPLLVLLAVSAFAAVVLAATFVWKPATGRRPAAIATSVIVVAIVMFALPFWPPRAIDAAAAPSRPSGAIRVADAGATEIRTGDVANAAIWAQIENSGPQLQGTRVEFTIGRPGSTDSVWTGGYADVSWAASERRRVQIDWDSRGATPGTYTVTIAVLSADRTLTYAKSEAAIVQLGS